MNSDECIVLDENDVIIGQASKKEAHIFSPQQPRGILHRAFSVFLFDSKGRLLLQQRAASKITFPNVWTNTCCSHPLTGFTPDEVDVAHGSSNGVKAAAVRKLLHELGIPAKQVPISKFKYLTRLHYWAADVVTHGPDSPWGEHEIDYILFIQADVTIKANPEEVSATKYVTLAELQQMMRPSSGLLWSPWFRIIAEQFLVHWWADLDKTLTTDAFVDHSTIHRFDPSSEHMGGAGNAGEWLGKASYKPSSPARSNASANSSKNSGDAREASTSASLVGDKNLKQGAYGKVKIHKHSKIDQLMRIDEVFAAVWFKFGKPMESKIVLKDENFRFCDDMLGKVSRSFAMVIRQLPRGLCIDILIFYLVLRALDTIEDDMKAFKGRESVKIDHLKNFYRRGLVTDGWTMDGVGEGDEMILLQQFHSVVAVYKSLSAASQDVIADITKRMGEGMASYVQKDLGQGTETIEDYNLYCHYVAGLVGEGLSRLFHCCGYESVEVANVSKTLANTMGLFLQKNNIIRDYLEDHEDGRAFWPQSVWKKYTLNGNGKLGEFKDPKAIDRALACLNHLVTDALECVPDCLTYMSMLTTEEVFRFCAIPQVMAIATLAELYNNPKVFTGVVKIRKGQTCKLILDTTTVGGLHKWFNVLTKDILSRVPDHDPNATKTRAICHKIIQLTEKEAWSAIVLSYLKVCNVIAAVGIAYCSFKLSFGKREEKVRTFPIMPNLQNLQNEDMVYAASFVVLTTFIFGYSIFAGGLKGLKKAD